MISHVIHHYQPTFWDALWACVCPHKFTLLASSFGAKISFNFKMGVRFWFELTQGNSIFPMPLLRFFSSNTHYVHNVIFWKFLAFISLATWCGTFVQFPPPLKGSWCPHHNVHFLCFFVSLLWNSYMASWACSMPNAFTQDAFIIWYIFHLTKYSYSHPLIALIWTKPLLETHVHY